MRTPRISPALVLALMLLAASSTGCALWSPVQQPPRPVEAPRVPPPPADLMVPPSSGSWSDSVQQLFKRWQDMLTSAKPA